MYQKTLTKVNQMYLAWGGILIIVAVMFIFTFRGIFSAVTDANKVDDSLLDTSIPRLNKGDLDRAYEISTNKDVSVLDLKD